MVDGSGDMVRRTWPVTPSGDGSERALNRSVALTMPVTRSWLRNTRRLDTAHTGWLDAIMKIDDVTIAALVTASPMSPRELPPHDNMLTVSNTIPSGA